MSKNKVAVMDALGGRGTITQIAAKHGMSRQHFHRLIKRYHEGGLEALDPGSRRPHRNPRATPTEVRDRIVQLRRVLTATGFDAGPATIAWHLGIEDIDPPALSTIRRILHTAGLITPAPRKRPRNSYRSFAADQPNELWQSDFTHWSLADGTDTEVLNFLDDHSRYLLGCTAHQPVTGDDVVTDFLAAAEAHGLPAATLTDNGLVYTTRFAGPGGGRNAFEHLLTALGISQKNGRPGHPQTQGKIERFHQTLKLWLVHQPRPTTLCELQEQLDRFRNHYNEHRPHRANQHNTPGHAYRAGVKALPANQPATGPYRIRYDHVDPGGKMSLRRAGRMHHLGIGIAHAGNPVLAIIDPVTVTVIHLHTSEILSTHTVAPERTYWRNEEREPGRWPDSRSSVTDDSTQV